MRKVFLLLILFCFSCVKNTPLYTYHTNIEKYNEKEKEKIPIYIDKYCNFIPIINQVINEWNLVLNNQIKFYTDGNFDKNNQTEVENIEKKINLTSQGIAIICINSDLDVKQEIPKEILAFVNDIGEDGHSLIILLDRIGNRDIHQILLHEIAHLLGAQHVSAISLMYQSYGKNQVNCIDKITMLQIAQYNKLDPVKLNYCSIPMLE